MRTGVWGSVLLMLAASVPALGQEEAALAEEGRRIARQACADCHGGEGRKPVLGAPDFAEVAPMPSTTATSIRVFLKTPHGTMPDLILSEREVDALAAYILSLAGR